MKQRSFLTFLVAALFTTVLAGTDVLADKPHKNKAATYLNAAVVQLDLSHVQWSGVAYVFNVFIETGSDDPICILTNGNSNDSGALMNAWCDTHAIDGRMGIRIWVNLNWYPSVPADETFWMTFVLFQNGAESYGEPEVVPLP